MNAYEITYIIRPDLDEDQTRAVMEQVATRLQAADAEIIAALPWNPPRRRMAYTINDFGDGFYVTTVFRVDPDALRGIENTLKLNERILRYLLVQATDMNIQQAQQRLAQQQAAAAAPRPQPAEAQPGAPPAMPAAAPVQQAPAAAPAQTAPAQVETEAAPAPTAEAPAPAPAPEPAPIGAPGTETTLPQE